MKKILVLALVVACGAQPALAQSGATEAAPPARFKDKHPKVYKAFRKTRFVCILVKPIVEVTAEVAQIVLPFII